MFVCACANRLRHRRSTVRGGCRPSRLHHRAGVHRRVAHKARAALSGLSGQRGHGRRTADVAPLPFAEPTAVRVRLGALGNPAACTPRLAEWSADILNDSVRLRARADGLQTCHQRHQRQRSSERQAFQGRRATTELSPTGSNRCWDRDRQPARGNEYDGHGRRTSPARLQVPSYQQTCTTPQSVRDSMMTVH